MEKQKHTFLNCLYFSPPSFRAFISNDKASAEAKTEAPAAPPTAQPVDTDAERGEKAKQALDAATKALERGAKLGEDDPRRIRARYDALVQFYDGVKDQLADKNLGGGALDNEFNRVIQEIADDNDPDEWHYDKTKKSPYLATDAAFQKAGDKLCATLGGTIDYRQACGNNPVLNKLFAYVIGVQKSKGAKYGERVAVLTNDQETDAEKERRNKILFDYINKIATEGYLQPGHGRVLTEAHIAELKAKGVEALAKVEQDGIDKAAADLALEVQTILRKAPEAQQNMTNVAAAGVQDVEAEAATSSGSRVAAGEGAAAKAEGATAEGKKAAVTETAPRKPRKLNDAALAQRGIKQLQKLGLPGGNTPAKLREVAGVKSDATDAEVVAAFRKAQTDAWDKLTPEQRSRLKAKTKEVFVDGIPGPQTKLAMDMVSKNKGTPMHLQSMLARLSETPARAEALASKDTGAKEAVAAAPTFKSLLGPKPLSVTPLIINTNVNEEPESARNIKRGDVLVAKLDLKEGRFKIKAGDPVQVVETHPEDTTTSLKGRVLVQTAEGYQASFIVDNFKGSTEDDVGLFDEARELVTEAMRVDKNQLETKKGNETAVTVEKFGDRATHFALIAPGTTIKYFGKFATVDTKIPESNTVAIIGKGALKTGEGYYVRTKNGAEGWVVAKNIVDGSIVAKVNGEDLGTIDNRVADAADIKKREIAANTAPAKKALQPV